MRGDATTFPLGGTADGEQTGSAGGGRLSGGWARSLAGTDSGVLRGTLALASILVLSLFIVLIAANRPSVLSPTTHPGYFPHWMAGPLGGLLPGFTSDNAILKDLFTGAIVVMYGGYVIALKHAQQLRARWVIAAIVAVHGIFLLSPPLALTDLFNYINYGRMEVVHGLNPYTTIPVLEPHNDPSFLLSNWHELLSPYGPLFTLLTFVVVPLGVAGSFWAIKSILVLTSLATILLVWKCARLLGRDPLSAVALVGLNPIVLVWGLGGDHNDFLMVFFIMLGFYLLLRAHASGVSDADAASPTNDWAAWRGGLSPRRLREWLLPLSALEIGAGAAFVTATAIKASGGVLIPVVLVGLLRAPRALAQALMGMAVAGVVIFVASLLAFGTHVPDLSTQSSLVTSESVPNLLGLAIGLGGESAGLRTVLSGVLVLLVVACGWLAWSRKDSITASGWASIALLVTLSWVLPWYVLWVLPLAALSGSRRLRTTALVLGVYLIIAWSPSSGLLWHAIGFRPERTPLGRLHQRYVRELLN
jgi:hypothetical protein